jgi:hypothetical protein
VGEAGGNKETGCRARAGKCFEEDIPQLNLN